MKLLNGTLEEFVVSEHFLHGTKPSEFTNLLVGTGTITYEGADKGTGKVVLYAPALNDEVTATMELPLMANKWKRIEVTFTDVIASSDDRVATTYLIGLNFDGNNLVSFLPYGVNTMRCRVRNNGVETQVNVSSFNPKTLNRFKITLTNSEADFYINETLVATISINVPIDKSLKPILYLKQQDTVNPKSLKCDKVEVKLYK